MAPGAKLERGAATLVVVDIQERLAAVMPRREQVISETGRLVRTAALVGMPVVVTRQYPRGLGDTDPALAAVIDEVARAGANVSVIDKVSFDCFGEEAFARALESAGRSTLLVAGMETHICVTQTTLTALQRDFEVHVAADACCSRQDVSHALALERMRAAGAVVTVTESAMYELVGVAGTDEFRALLSIVKGE